MEHKRGSGWRVKGSDSGHLSISPPLARVSSTNSIMTHVLLEALLLGTLGVTLQG